jgi:hypothetical protein
MQALSETSCVVGDVVDRTVRKASVLEIEEITDNVIDRDEVQPNVRIGHDLERLRRVREQRPSAVE